MARRTRSTAPEPTPDPQDDEPLLPGGPAPIDPDAVAADALEDARDDQDESDALTDALLAAETVGGWTRPSLELLRIVRARLEDRVLTLSEPPALDGLRVVTLGNVDEAFREPLPPASTLTAEVQTPATLYVDLVCPLCGIAQSAIVELRAVLTVEGASRELKAKAASKGRAHTCGQTRISDVTPDQTTLDDVTEEPGPEVQDAEGGDAEDGPDELPD